MQLFNCALVLHQPVGSPKGLGKINAYHDSFQALNPHELQSYFDELANILSETEEKVGINLSSGDHAVFLSFNKEKNGWECFDINTLGSDKPLYQSSFFPKEKIGDFLSQSLKSFRPKYTGHSSLYRVFSSRAFGLRENQELTQKLKALDEKHSHKSHAKRVNSDEHSLLSMVASRGQKESVDRLLKQGANPKQRNVKGMTPLHYALTQPDVTLTQSLLDAGANIDTPDYLGQNPLMFSIHCKNKSMSSFLLTKNPNIHLKMNDGWNALMVAASKGDTGMIKALLAREPALHEVDNMGMNAVMLAVGSGNTEAVRMLIDAGVDPNQENYKGGTPLTLACTRGDLAMVTLLLQKGAQNIETHQGTPYKLALEEKQQKIAYAMQRHFGATGQTKPQPRPKDIIQKTSKIDALKTKLEKYIDRRMAESKGEKLLSGLTLGLSERFLSQEPSKKEM